MFDASAVVAGLDVHKASTRVVAVQGDRLVWEGTVASDPPLVEAALRRVGVIACWYEAGPTGFGLARHLGAVGIRCDVVAPGLVWRRPGDRVKTDPRDARRLAAQFAGGMLEAIFVPTVATEALRDLVGAREDARHDRMRARARLGKFLLRHGRVMPTRSWSVQRRAWLEGRQPARPPAARGGVLESPPPPRGELHDPTAPPRPAPPRDRARHARRAAPASPLAADAQPRQGRTHDRRRRRA
jgi:transposase